MTRDDFIKKYGKRLSGGSPGNAIRVRSRQYLKKYLNEVHNWPYNSFEVASGYYKLVTKAFDSVIFSKYMTVYLDDIDRQVKIIEEEIHHYRAAKALAV
jgi:hypothetical protein